MALPPRIETTLTRQQVKSYIQSGAWSERRLWDYVIHTAGRHPHRTAVTDERGSYTYGELVALSNRVALGLLSLGVRPGDVVGIQLPNWREFLPMFLGVERVGAVVNPLTTILRERELAQMLEIGQVTVLVVPSSYRGFDHAAAARALRDTLPDLQQVIVAGGHAPAGTHGWEDLLAGSDHPAGALQVLDLLAPRGTDIAELAFTSGTTGAPKGVMHVHNSIVSTVGSTIKRQGLDPTDIFHVAAPVGHNAGYFFGVRLALQSGGRIVLQDTWDADTAVELLRSHRVTYSIGTSTHLIDLLGAPGATGEALASLRVYTCAGAHTPPHVAREALRVIPRAFRRAYGMTEIGHTTSTDSQTSDDRVTTTEGSPQPEMEVRVVDDAGVPLVPGEEGHVQVKGPFLFAGYIQGREFTDQFFQDGFFDTGDIGHLDRDNYLTLTGRTKDIIIRGGEKIPTREVENVLGLHSKVRQAVIVPVKDARLGERAVACIQLREGERMHSREVLDFLEKERVTKQFWPEEVVFVDGFPMTGSGKIQKSRLSGWLEQRVPEVAGAKEAPCQTNW